MTALTILATVLFAIALIGFIFVLILPTVKKIIINISALTLILAVLFINLIKDIKRAIKYATIG